MAELEVVAALRCHQAADPRQLRLTKTNEPAATMADPRQLKLKKRIDLATG
jgi:hypothetical protein